MDIENNPQGLSLDQAFEQLKANRNQTPQEEHFDEVSEEVVEEVQEEEESEEELEESEEGSEEEEGEAEEEESEEPEEEIFELEIDGEQVEVSLDELHKGYLRHNDYTRKRQTDARRAKELEAEYQTKLESLERAIVSNRAQDETQYQKVVQAMNNSTDPAQRQQLHYQALQLQQAISQRQALQKQTADLQTKAQAAQQEAKLAEQVELLRTEYEDWDSKQEELVGYLTKQGFDDFSPFVDARMAIMIDKAKQFDELQQTREKVVKKKIKRKVPKTVKAGQGEKAFNVNQEKVQNLSNNFAKSKNIKDALALLQARRGR